MSIKVAITATEYPDLSLRQIFEKAKQLGVRYVELILPKNMDTSDSTLLHDLMEESGIGVACVTPQVILNAPGADVERSQDLLVKCIHLAKETGANLVCTYFGGNPHREHREAIDAYVRNVGPCVREAEAMDVTLVLENEYNYEGPDATQTPEGCLEIIQAVGSPRFKLNFDTGNFHVGGTEAYPYAYQMLKEHVKYIHAKNVVKYSEALHGRRTRLQIDRTTGGSCLCVSLGEGAINFEAFITRLKEDGYQGFLTIEPHTPEGDLDDTFRKGVEYLRRKGIPG